MTSYTVDDSVGFSSFILESTIPGNNEMQSFDYRHM